MQLVKKRDSAKSKGGAVSGHVYVDTSCGQELLFRFGQLDMQRTYDITVRSPSGVNYTNSKVDNDTETITVGVNETEVGNYYISVPFNIYTRGVNWLIYTTQNLLGSLFRAVL